MQPRVRFFQKQIKVESHSSESSQAAVFFGRETNLGIRVVLKQYKSNLHGIFREIKIFTEIERNKEESKPNGDGNRQQSQTSSLPNLLCYVIG